nr:chloride channel protein [uncultured Lichenicoccus sp.]
MRAVACADHHRPKGPWRLVGPAIALTAPGAASIPFPQLLGNGRDIARLAFIGQVGPLLLVSLLVLRPAATLLCLGSGTPGGLFTSTLAIGALLSEVLEIPWSYVRSGSTPGQRCWVPSHCCRRPRRGRSSATELMMELTGHARAFIVPLLLIVALATLVARTIEPRSIYDARLTDAEVLRRQRDRDPQSGSRANTAG